VVSPDFVVLSQIVSMRIRFGAESDVVQRMVTATSVWTLTQDGWRLVAMQATPKIG
jgi:ketosteroid isomerase-like protein